MPDDNYTYTPATPANMAAYEGKHGRSARALDTCTGDLMGATSGDYFTMGPDDALVSEEDRETPLALVVDVTVPTYRDALTGAVIGGNGDTHALDELHAYLYENPDTFPSGREVCERLAEVLGATGRAEINGDDDLEGGRYNRRERYEHRGEGEHPFLVETAANGERLIWADSVEHARELHADLFDGDGDEILAVRAGE